MIVTLTLPSPAVCCFRQRDREVLKGQGHVIRGVIEAMIAGNSGKKEIFHHGVLTGPVIDGEDVAAAGEALALLKIAVHGFLQLCLVGLHIPGRLPFRGKPPGSQTREDREQTDGGEKFSEGAAPIR